MRQIHSYVIRCVAICLLIGWGCGSEAAAEKQVSNLKAIHRAGQTFVTWEEISHLDMKEPVSVRAIRERQQTLQESTHLQYNIYRSPSPITSVNGMTPLARVGPLSCWNTELYGRSPQPEHKALRYVIKEDSPPLPAGTGLYVYNPPQAGQAYYAVTVSLNGHENTMMTRHNTLSQPVKEEKGQGIPVLQRIKRPEAFQYIPNPTLYYFTRWESPPHCSITGKPYDYLVAIPPEMTVPAPVGIHLHCWGGSLNGGYAWWNNGEKGAILLATNQFPYDWWTGYHELLWTGQPLKTPEDWQQGVVRPFTTRRLFGFMEWMRTRWELDLTRTFAAGSSMGGSGSLMLAIRYPERIAWARSWVGVHIPDQSPGFVSSYSRVYGKPEYEVQFEDGTPVWNYYNDAWYMRRHPEKEIGFMTFSNGKNDANIGWAQAVEFLRALQETRRPHLFIWGQRGHSQRTIMPLNGSQRVMPIDIRTDQTLPAFTNCSLDNDPGNGNPDDGEPTGQINRYLYWQTGDIVDNPNQWEMTVGLIPKAPEDRATVHITPRRCQHFAPEPGETVHWTNIDIDRETVLQSGDTVVDQWGLVTLKQVIIAKGTHRISLSR